ncbi:uncharacterized protein ARMOST_18006 [Armillaria ostoyae]|uniref:Uncharacterized protein n=1 Tax=Armillaria ostoyae TaxID=47428 RepID=A0A284S0M1_ARMOS|nr:uncharacterized protein ARMOST_18006 [Armillaria ostoyae]
MGVITLDEKEGRIVEPHFRSTYFDDFDAACITHNSNFVLNSLSGSKFEIPPLCSHAAYRAKWERRPFINILRASLLIELHCVISDEC